jgi:hypothetical protein
LRFKKPGGAFSVLPQSERGISMDYQKEYHNALLILKKEGYQKAIPVLLNALWLYFHHRQLIVYRKFLTNREYLKELAGYSEYKTVFEIIGLSEILVYGGESIEESQGEAVFEKARGLFVE